MLPSARLEAGGVRGSGRARAVTGVRRPDDRASRPGKPRPFAPAMFAVPVNTPRHAGFLPVFTALPAPKTAATCGNTPRSGQSAQFRGPCDMPYCKNATCGFVTTPQAH